MTRLPWEIVSRSDSKYFLTICLFIIFLLSSIMLPQYFLELMKVPRVESKLRVLSFKVHFGTQVRWYYLLSVQVTVDFGPIVNDDCYADIRTQRTFRFGKLCV